MGGHANEFVQALIDLGMDPETCCLPDDLTVVQLGDLIHRGPDSGSVLALVRKMLVTQPEQWVQLVGNHEGIYLPFAPRFPWSETLNQGGEDLLKHWWATGQMRVAAGLSTAHGDLLVTHAGLTTGLWSKIGRPTNIRDAVPALNALPEKHPDWLWRTGKMYDGRDSDWNAGPMWAEAGSEVYASWMGIEADNIPVPFGQVHGHSSAYNWDRKQWRANRRIADRFALMPRVRHLRGVIGSQPFIGIDPDFGRSIRGPWAPLVFDAARVVAR
jgi:hypothetical protein